MCGICGYLSKKKYSDEIVEQIRDTMIHRGPNDAGIWQGYTDLGYIGLAHRRLSILDLSQLGHQPMISNDSDTVIAYNGEIYNFLELREILKEDGYVFKSECDTEVIIAAYQKWKTECFSHFNGMFAIAIWDNRNEKLILARDRIGKKPIYYYFNSLVNDFVFASELKPIMLFPGFKKNIREESGGEFLCNKYICPPNTIFENTFKLEPGRYLIYDNTGIEIKRYWNIVERYDYLSEMLLTDRNEMINNLSNILEDSVSKRMIADVPVGTFLSGGIDSTLITALAQQHSDHSIKSFSIGFYDKERNEAPFAKEIAKYLGTEHTEIYVEDDTVQGLLADLPKYFDEPFSDSSQLPMMLVSKLAADDVVVALSGDGGDELFCGYNMYDLVYIAQKTDWIGDILRRIIINTDWIPSFCSEIKAFLNNGDNDYKTQLFSEVTSDPVSGLLLNNRHVDARHNVEKEVSHIVNWQERRMLLDMMTYLPDDILMKTDRASMKYSLEVRCPMLDYRFVEASMRIPHKNKYYRFDKKHILKEIAYRYVPKELLDRPKKGFGVPLRKWIRTSLKGNISEYSRKESLIRQGIFDANAMKRLTDIQSKSNKIQYSSILWSYYVFQRWYQEYIEDLWN